MRIKEPKVYDLDGPKEKRILRSYSKGQLEFLQDRVKESDRFKKETQYLDYLLNEEIKKYNQTAFEDYFPDVWKRTTQVIDQLRKMKDESSYIEIRELLDEKYIDGTVNKSSLHFIFNPAGVHISIIRTERILKDNRILTDEELLERSKDSEEEEFKSYRVFYSINFPCLFNDKGDYEFQFDPYNQYEDLKPVTAKADYTEPGKISFGFECNRNEEDQRKIHYEKLTESEEILEEIEIETTEEFFSLLEQLLKKIEDYKKEFIT